MPLRLYLCVKVGDFEKKSVCVKPGTARFAARKTIKYYPLSPYAKRLPFGPVIPFVGACGAVLRPCGRILCKQYGEDDTGAAPVLPEVVAG